MFDTPPEYDRVATDEDAFALGTSNRLKIAETADKADRAMLHTCPETFGLYIVLDRIRYNIEPILDARSRGNEISKSKKISAVWLTTFGWRPRLGVFKLSAKTNNGLYDRYRDSGHGEHSSSD